MFNCALNTTDSDIANNDVQWYRFIESTGTTEIVDKHGEGINFITHTTRNIINSSLTVTNARTSHNGYFWARVPSFNVCNVSLSVGTSTYICKYVCVP